MCLFTDSLFLFLHRAAPFFFLFIFSSPTDENTGLRYFDSRCILVVMCICSNSMSRIRRIEMSQSLSRRENHRTIVIWIPEFRKRSNLVNRKNFGAYWHRAHRWLITSSLRSLQTFAFHSIRISVFVFVLLYSSNSVILQLDYIFSQDIRCASCFSIKISLKSKVRTSPKDERKILWLKRNGYLIFLALTLSTWRVPIIWQLVIILSVASKAR